MNETITQETVRTVTMPTEAEIREYLQAHLDRLSLLEFAQWIIERDERQNMEL